MPRDSSGNYTLPLGNPVIPDTLIESAWANSTMSDIATQLNNVITRDGLLGPTAPVKFTNGSVAAPSLTFNGGTNSGFYRTAVKIGVSWQGTEVAFFNNDGITTSKWFGAINSGVTHGIYIGQDPVRMSGTINFYKTLDFFFELEDVAPKLIFGLDGNNDPAWYTPLGLKIYGAQESDGVTLDLDNDGNLDIVANTSKVARYHSLEVGWRDLPFASISGAGASPTISQRGYIIDTTADVVLPINVFSRGNIFTLNNNTNTTLNITIEVGGTMRRAGTTDVGARTIAPQGMMTVVWISGTVCKVSGPGVS